MHVLIVEDDQVIAENLYDYLESCGHQCDFAASLSAAKPLLKTNDIDVVVLDRNLPDGDAVVLVKSLRHAGENLPILMLTARDALDDKVSGFDAGVDDYLAKPFALKEVELRLQALHRRSLGNTGRVADSLIFGPLSYEAQSHNLTLNGSALSLPPKALRLILVLLSYPERLFTRRQLELAVWGEAQQTSDNLRSVLLTLRKAFAEGNREGAAVEVRNVHGQGYKLVQS